MSRRGIDRDERSVWNWGVLSSGFVETGFHG
jgi:hypothetical protein